MKISDFHKNFLTLVSGNGLAQVVPFAVGPILSRLYSPEDFGGYSNFMALMSLFVIIACGRMELAIMLPQLKEEALDVVRKCLYFLKWVLGGSLICALFFSESLSHLFRSPEIKQYVMILPLFVLVNGFYVIAYNWLNRMSKYKVLASSKLFLSIIIALINIIMGYMGYGVAGLILANLIGMASLLLFFRKTIFEIWRGIRERKGKDLAYIEKKYSDFPRVNLAHAFVDVANQQFLFNLIFTTLFGVQAMGFYALAARYVRGPMRSFHVSISQVYFNEASALAREGQAFTHLLRRSVKTTAVIALPFLIVLVFFAPDLFVWFFGGEWYEAGKYAQALSPALCVQLIISPVSMTPIICSKQKEFFAWSVFGQLSALTIIWMLGKHCGFSVYTCLWAYSIFIVVYSIGTLIWFFHIASRSSKDNE